MSWPRHPRREITAFWARRIRWGLIAGASPQMWPVYIYLPATRRAFWHTFRMPRRLRRYIDPIRKKVHG